MSRYSKQELEKLRKAQLLELIRRQPEVSFPPKIGSGPVESLSVRQLRVALAGPHGYVKATPTTSLEGSQAPEVAPMLARHDDRKSLSPLPSALGPESDPIPEPVVYQLATSVQTISLNSEGSVDQEVPKADFAKPAYFSRDVSMEDNDLDMNLVPQATNSTRTAEPSETQSSSSACVSSASSSSTVDNIFESYPIDAKTDEALLDEYFKRNPQLLAQVTHMKAHRRKHQTDDALVRDYRFNVALHGTLMGLRWEDNTRRILGKSILEYLGISAPWLAKARNVVALLDRIGPKSPNPDPLVVERLSSTAVTKKGDDILKFLKDRFAAIDQEAGGNKS